MQLGFTKSEILTMLDSHLTNFSDDLEKQVVKAKETNQTNEIGLATIVTSSMLSLLESVSAIIEVNNQKIYEDLKLKGIIREEN